MVQKAKKVQTSVDRIRALNSHKSTLYALNRFKQSPVTSGSAFFANSGGAAGGSTAASGNFLRTAGDTMVGPIAYYPATVLINGSDELDISPDSFSPQSSSYIIVSFSSPDKIQLIKGAQFAGQQMWLQCPAGSTLTLEDYSNNATGNVVTSDGADLVITTTADPVTFTLIFDVTLSPNANNGGWVVLNAKAVTGATGGGSFATKALNNLVVPTLNVAIDFNQKAPTNFNGYTSHVIGNLFLTSTSGSAWSLPTGDAYTWNIDSNATMKLQEAEIRFVGSDASRRVDTFYEMHDTTPSDATTITKTSYLADNITPSQIVYAEMSAIVDDVTAGTEDASLKWSVIRDGVAGDTNMTLQANDLTLQSGLAVDMIITRQEITSPATGLIGSLIFKTEDSASNPTQFGVIEVDADVITNGAEDSRFTMKAIDAGTTVTFLEYDNGALTLLDSSTQQLGFYGSAGNTRQTVSGSTAGNAALQGLLAAMANLGIIVDTTT